MTDLVALRDARRAEAIEAGQDLERAKANGKKMRDIRWLEREHAQAWSRFYAIDNLIPRTTEVALPYLTGHQIQTRFNPD